MNNKNLREIGYHKWNQERILKEMLMLKIWKTTWKPFLQEVEESIGIHRHDNKSIQEIQPNIPGSEKPMESHVSAQAEVTASKAGQSSLEAPLEFESDVHVPVTNWNTLTKVKQSKIRFQKEQYGHYTRLKMLAFDSRNRNEENLSLNSMIPSRNIVHRVKPLLC